MKRRTFDGLLIAFLIIFLATGSWWFWTVGRVVRPFKRIAREDTEARVTALLGKPRIVFANGEMMKETADRDDLFLTAGRGIEKKFWYDTFLFGPYVVGFDSDGRAVAKFRSNPPKR